MELIDSHCHINFPELGKDTETLLARMRDADVSTALCVSVTLESFPQVLGMAEAHPGIYASVGVHPDETTGEDPSTDTLVRLSENPRIVAIGETGLDYYRLEGDLEWQRQRFRNHIRAARTCGKPLIIHTRSAGTDTIRIMREEGADRIGGVMHCFTETWEFAQAALELGFLISFSGILTFKNAKELREVARKVPLESILVETDSPYLAPVPHRGKTNEPAYVRFVAEELARIKQLPLETVAAATTENFRRLFRTDTRQPQDAKTRAAH
jgi:TatD DNase family protein